MPSSLNPFAPDGGISVVIGIIVVIGLIGILRELMFNCMTQISCLETLKNIYQIDNSPFFIIVVSAVNGTFPISMKSII